MSERPREHPAYTALRILGPRIPLILKTAALQTIGWTEESAKWDLKAAVIVTTLRSIMGGAASTMTAQQRFGLRPTPVKGPIWVSKATVAASSDSNVLQALCKAIDDLKTSDETYTRPNLVPVEGEWTAHRAGVGANELPPANMSESEKFQKILGETTSKSVVLYIHGGGFVTMDPASHRALLTGLVKKTGGRAFSVRYRLSPQHPFPAALLDCLVAYLSLLYPPPGSVHEAIDPAQIVFAGDSAGGNLSFTLSLLIAQLQKSDTTIKWHGRDVKVPSPAGVTGNAPWLDITNSLPSGIENAKWDYLPSTHFLAEGVASARPDQESSIVSTVTRPAPKPCKIWPTDPPRADPYADGPTMCHPLVSALSASDDLLKALPPVLMVFGEEMLLDGGKVLGRRLAGLGKTARLVVYEGMPHVFVFMFPEQAVGQHCYNEWAQFVKQVTTGQASAVQTEAIWVQAKTLKEQKRDWADLLSMDDQQVKEAMQTEREWRQQKFLENEDQMKQQVAERKAVAPGETARL